MPTPGSGDFCHWSFQLQRLAAPSFCCHIFDQHALEKTSRGTSDPPIRTTGLFPPRCPVSRLSKLFRSSSRPVTRKTHLGVEALDGRLLPSVTFTEHPDHSVEVRATAHQNNASASRNDGDGNLRIVADGVVRNFIHVPSLVVNTGDGKDTVTYNQGTSTQNVNLHRNFSLQVDLGSQFDSNDADHFTANV